MAREYSKEKKEERLDSGFMGMISEDHSAPANLPQHVVHKFYPKENYIDMHELDDTIRGVDGQVDDSVRKIEEHPSKGMY